MQFPHVRQGLRRGNEVLTNFLNSRDIIQGCYWTHIGCRFPTVSVAANSPEKPSVPADLKRKTKSLLEEYFNVLLLNEAQQCIEELNTATHNPEVIKEAISLALELNPPRIEDLEALNQTLIVKERKSNDELQEARKELINLKCCILYCAKETSYQNRCAVYHFGGEEFSYLVQRRLDDIQRTIPLDAIIQSCR